MKKILLTIFLLFPLAANATIISFDFEGEFRQPWNNYANIGDKFVGKVSYELGGLDTDPDDEIGLYSALEFSFEFNGFTGYATNADLSIINGTNDDFGCCGQYVVWGGRTNNTFGMIDGYSLQSVGFGLYNFSQYVFSNTQLPISIPKLTDFEESTFSFSYVLDPNMPNDNVFGASGIITSITASTVNEPKDIFLIAVLLSLLLYRSKKAGKEIL